jgi:RNA polymerase sigma-70 factor (ECF subfamily)
VDRKPDFEQLVDRYGSEIFAFLYRMLGNSAEAEDVLQESFLKAFAAYERIAVSANYRAWLYKIANNTAKTRFRRKNQQVELHSPELPAAGPGVEALVEERIWLQRVRREVDRLPFKQRASLMLRNYQGLSYAEIAEALEISPEAARANVYQGLKKLKERFAAELADLQVASTIAAK